MTSFWIYFSMYGFGCFSTMVFFMVGRTPALNERNWPWPVIFLWPLLLLWPIHALAGIFIKRTTQKQK